MKSSPLLCFLICARQVTSQVGLYDEIGFGTFDDVTTSTSLSFVNATQNPAIRSDFAFTGFNVTRPLNSEISGTPESNEQWQFRVGYTAANATDGSNDTIEVYSYALDFSRENFEANRYPLNSSDLQICATIIPMSFSSSVSHKSGNSRNASCGQYIGNACAEAWTQAFATAPISQALGCRTPPSLSGIDECKDIGTASSAGTAAISNSTLEGIVHYAANNSYVDTETGFVYTLDDLPFQGLSSGQTFGYVSKTGQAAAAAKNATNLQLVVLTLEPEPSRAREIGSYGYGSEVRLLCGRASAADVSGAVHLRPSWILGATLLVAFSVLHLA